MFNIGFSELSLICIVALLVIGPEKLPGLVRDISRLVRKLRRSIVEARYELEREFDFEEEKKDFEARGKKLLGKIDDLDNLMEIAPDRESNTNKEQSS